MELSHDEIGTLVLSTNSRLVLLRQYDPIMSGIILEKERIEVEIAETEKLHSRLCHEYQTPEVSNTEQCSFQWSNLWGTYRCPHSAGHGYDVPMELPHVGKDRGL